MDAVTQFLEAALGPVAFIFTASNLAVMGLQVKGAEVTAALTRPKTLLAIVLWGWVLGPIVALLIAWALPLSDAFVIGLILYSLAPCAPFLPLMIQRAGGDVAFAGALVPLVAIGTVIFAPIMAPLLIDEVTLSSWDLAQLFLLSVVLPLAVGSALRSNAEPFALKIFPAADILAKLSALAAMLVATLLYWREMLDTAGSFGLLSMTMFMVVMGLITYRRFGFGLAKNQRSVMALGMLTRNGSVVLLAALSIPDVDPSLITFVIMYIVWMIVVAAIAARIFGRLAAHPEA